MPRCGACRQNPCRRGRSWPPPSVDEDRPADDDEAHVARVHRSASQSTARSGRGRAAISEPQLLAQFVSIMHECEREMPFMVIKGSKGKQTLMSYADGLWEEGEAQFRTGISLTVLAERAHTWLRRRHGLLLLLLLLRRWHERIPRWFGGRIEKNERADHRRLGRSS